MRTLTSLLRLLAAAAAMWLLSGCETTEQNRESDIPWNQPQPWEGAPGIPGMGAQ